MAEIPESEEILMEWLSDCVYIAENSKGRQGEGYQMSIGEEARDVKNRGWRSA